MDFLHLHKLGHKCEKKKKRFFLFSESFLHVLNLAFYFLIILLVSGLVLIFIGGAKFLPAAVNVYSKTMSGKEKIENVKNLFDGSENYSMKIFSEAEFNLSSAKGNFQEAGESLENLKLLKKIPGIKNQYVALDNLLGAAVETTSCLEEIVKWLNGQDLDFDKIDKKKILGSLSDSDSFWQERKKQIRIAQDLLTQISEQRALDPIQKAAQNFEKKLTLLKKGVEEVEVLSQILPLVLGLDQEKIYLFLLQNNTELRPSGGFLGTYGILKIKDGEILSFKTDNIYNLDKNLEGILEIEPPWPLKKYNKINYWFTRDANWSPDFPTSARKVEWFYKTNPAASVVEFDGIIAIDSSFVTDLFDFTGSIKINNIKFTKENFVDLLQWQVGQAFRWQGVPEEERKKIIQDIFEKMQEKIFGLSINQWPDLYKVINKNLEEKHILLYFHDSDLKNYILAKNWGGQIQESRGDYLMVVDANLGSLKSDPKVKRSKNYDLRFKNGEGRAKLTITYDHQGEFDWKTTRYRTYVRIYTPEGSELISCHSEAETDSKQSKGKAGAIGFREIPEKLDVEITQEFGKTVFGTFISIEPGEKKKLVLEYKLPEKIIQQIENDQYHLLVQKQPGTQAHGLSLDLKFPYPLKSAFPAEKREEWGDARYRLETDLKVDRQIDLQMHAN